MSRAKDSSKKSGFERKQVNGKTNPKYVDLLEEDKPIAGQKFVCVSFCSPEKILKDKQIFYFEEFLKKWELRKSMEKFVQFLNFVSFKYNISFDDVSNDFKDFVKEEKESINKSSMDDDFKTFVDNSDEELQKKFDIAHNLTTGIASFTLKVLLFCKLLYFPVEMTTFPIKSLIFMDCKCVAVHLCCPVKFRIDGLNSSDKETTALFLD